MVRRASLLASNDLRSLVLTFSRTADEIQELRKEAAAIKQLRTSLTEDGAAQRVFDKVRPTFTPLHSNDQLTIDARTGLQRRHFASPQDGRHVEAPRATSPSHL